LLGLAALASVAAASATVDRAAAPSAAASADRQLISCGKTVTMGMLAPITGPAASLGKLQTDWAKFYVAAHNRNKKNKVKLRVQYGDTVLGGPGGTAEAVKAAQSLGSNVLATVGPAGSNEVRATTPTLKNAGLGFVSGSATNTELTTDGTRTNYFFRTVPPDSAQGTSVANFINKKLKFKRVYIIDDQEAYSTGLADEVQAQLKAKGVDVGRDGVSQQQSDFTSLINKIPRNMQLVYLPWQLPPKAKAFGQQMKSLGRGSTKLMGSDGLFDPQFSGLGSNTYDSFFPLNPGDKRVAAYKKIHHATELFGAPSYVATQVVVGAVDRACKNGSASRAEVRAQIKKTRIPAATSLLGLPVAFDAHGDMVKKPFGIYHSVKGVFVRVG
jgi:branched-chain amino acid transport system substrate-binding protein